MVEVIQNALGMCRSFVWFFILAKQFILPGFDYNFLHKSYQHYMSVEDRVIFCNVPFRGNIPLAV